MSTGNGTSQPTSSASPAGLPPAPHYQICIRGHLAPRWAAWFDGLDLDAADDGTTVLRGPVADQAALHGLLQKLRDIGIPLVSLTPIPIDPAAGRPDLHDDPTSHNTPGATP